MATNGDSQVEKQSFFNKYGSIIVSCIFTLIPTIAVFDHNINELKAAHKLQLTEISMTMSYQQKKLEEANAALIDLQNKFAQLHEAASKKEPQTEGSSNKRQYDPPVTYNIDVTNQ
ncbi:MAG: hypothetical protein L7F77_16380 [Candidatus Magnetominusculus sp. LBB02]|nr:hypothetical protein [Candidatus Magnetominusculus sp. LBB02]MCG6553901.1 hypothetical protein [Candidatus Magnetominusculus sp. LBB02]